LADSFECILITPQAERFSGSLSYATLPAWDGSIGVAPRRAPLVARLTDGVCRLDGADGVSKRFFLGGGFAQMKSNQLVILAEDALEPGEVTRADAETMLRDALALEAVTDDEVAARDRTVQRARGLAMLAAQA